MCYLSNWLWRYHKTDPVKYHFQIQLISNWKFWYLSVLFWRAKKKKICWMLQQGTEKSIFIAIFRNGCDFMMTMILQNTIFRFNLFEMESFDNCLCCVGNRRSGPIYFELKVLIASCVTLDSNQKNSVECRSKEQRKAFSELSFELALTLWLQWFCKLSFPSTTYFKFKVLRA